MIHSKSGAAVTIGEHFSIAHRSIIHGPPLAAEESTNPAKDVPKGIITAMCILTVFAFLVLLLAPGGAGAKVMSEHGAPLVGAFQAAYGED